MNLTGCILGCIGWISVPIVLMQDETMIIGSDYVEIAVQGESTAQYQAPEGFVFSLQEPHVGVDLDAEGQLTLHPDAQAGSIQLQAVQDDQVLSKEVTLFLSWTKQTETGSEYEIPAPTATRKINYMEKVERFLPFTNIRLFLCVSMLALFLAYAGLRRKK